MMSYRVIVIARDISDNLFLPFVNLIFQHVLLFLQLFSRYVIFIAEEKNWKSCILLQSERNSEKRKISFIELNAEPKLKWDIWNVNSKRKRLSTQSIKP